MWIGTTDGLNLYNANSIKIFKHEVRDKNSINNNYIQNICEDKSGNIWAGTATGAEMYIPSQNKFLHFYEDENKNPLGYKCRVYNDKKGNIFAARNGLFKFYPGQQVFKRINNPYSNKLFGNRLSNFISGFYNDNKGRYWVSTSDGLFLYNDDAKTFERFDTPPNDDNYKKFGILYGQVYETTSGELCVGTWGYGFFKIDVQAKKLIALSNKGVALNYAAQQLNGQEILWYAATGLQSVDEENKPLAPIVYKNSDVYSIRNDAVNCMFTDRQNQLWIGYEQSGIQIINPGNQLIKSYPLNSVTDKKQISSVSATLKFNNNLYVGGWYIDALCKLDSNFKIVKWWPCLPADVKNTSSNVSGIYVDSKGDFWITTFNGLIQLNEQKNKIEVYHFDTTVNYNNRFLKLITEGDSVLWLSGYDNGLTRFSLQTHKFELIGNRNARSLLWNITIDDHHNIWCANNDGYLEKFETKTRKTSVLNFDTLTERSIYYDVVFDSAENQLWIAGTSGLLKISLVNFHAVLFTEKDGLPSSHVNILCFDKKHHLWIGTDKGLSLYNRNENSFKNFYTNNGLITEKIDHSLYAGPDGKLYIGADNMVMVMDIEKINDQKKQVSPVYITAINENDNLLQPKITNNQKIIELPYNKNDLSFEFAITDYINPEDNVLLYRLQGWDKDFIATKTGKINYNQLPPGEYIFRVKGINHNGIKNEKEEVVTIIIHPPFWQSWWFITLISLAALALLVSVVRYISQRNLKEKLLLLENEQAIEKERSRISKDMHDDLGSGLTKIAIMSEVVKKQIHEPQKAIHQLENISASSRELVDNLQDIIWVLNPKNDTLENLAAYIREYSLKFFEPFGTEIKFSYPENFADIKLSEETRRNIFLTCKESFNNIAKHAWCNYVHFKIINEGKQVDFFIEDDGKGFDIKTARQFGNGLINMNNRIEQIGGTYTINSAINKGTVTHITILV